MIFIYIRYLIIVSYTRVQNMEKIHFIFFAILIPLLDFAQQPKLVSDATISFSISSTLASDQSQVGFKTIYLKGKETRTDLVSNSFKQTTFYNSITGDVTILKEVGQSKYISNYNADEWGKANSIYDSVVVTFLTGTKSILSYNCKQAVVKLKNGNTYSVFYTPEIIPSVVENPFEFKDIPGLVLEYESSVGETEKITYSAIDINFDPVPSALFDIPQKGYRILN